MIVFKIVFAFVLSFLQLVFYFCRCCVVFFFGECVFICSLEGTHTHDDNVITGAHNVEILPIFKVVLCRDM